MKYFQEVFKSDLQAVKNRLLDLHCKSLFSGAINHCFGNKSQTDPSPCYTNKEMSLKNCDLAVSNFD